MPNHQAATGLQEAIVAGNLKNSQTISRTVSKEKSPTTNPVDNRKST